MDKIGIAIIALALSTFSEGRKCWHCQNAKGNSECKRIGYLKQCLPNQEYCQNEIRAIGGGRYFEITKRCKQEVGCSNNKMQNYTGRVPFQCATEEPHSVCRCCCGFDNCNGPEIACIHAPPTCAYPDSPENGYTSCPSFLLIGVTCRYRCRPGFQLEGDTGTMCEMTISGVRWSNPPPRCTVKPCQPLVPPEEGSMSCTDEWNIASECTFSCSQGRVLVGQETLKCSIFSVWDGEVPRCEVVECFPPRPLDANFVPPQGICTDGYKYKSSCSFACDPDYNLVGVEQIICGPPIGSNNRATWSDRPPTCQKKTCTPIYPECSGNEVGDTCEFSCERCERLNGSEIITCTREGWSDLPPNCTTISCEKTPEPPQNGAISCESNTANECGDSCSFSCTVGYRLVGPSRTTCLPSGEWGDARPTCVIIECLPPRPLDDNFVPPEGTCTKEYHYNSECTYECDLDYNLVGTDTIICGLPIVSNNRATWSDSPPRCQLKTCEPRYTECSGNEVGDTCEFSCERCERMEGSSRIVCTRDGWSGSPPDCITITCTALPEPPTNGAIACDSDAKCDDSCIFSCDSGYELVGSSETTCLSTGVWSNETPICELTRCPTINLPGINKRCSNGNAVGSICDLTCANVDMEFIGDDQVHCRKDSTDPIPIWDPNLNQYCRFILCPNFPEREPRPDAGSITCSPISNRVTDDRDGRSGWKVGSKCTITCNENFQAQSLLFESDCERDAEWTVSPLCCVECVPNTALDVVVFIDRTEERLWNDRLSFLGRFIDFITFEYEFNLNITFIPFGEDVDYANYIDFMTIDDVDNLVFDLPGELNFLKERDEFIGIPSAAGQASNSGKALNEALRNIFGFHNSRVPMIFLLTSRAPSDLRLARQASQELADRKIHLRILPITGELSADAGTNRAVLQSLVESPDFLVEESKDESQADDFYIQAADQLISVTRRVCNQRAQRLQPCLYA